MFLFCTITTSKKTITTFEEKERECVCDITVSFLVLRHFFTSIEKERNKVEENLSYSFTHPSYE